MNVKARRRAAKSGKSLFVVMALAGILGTFSVANAESLNLGSGQTLNIATGTSDESKKYDSITIGGGTFNFGSVNDKAGSMNSAGNVTVNGGTITVTGSGSKVSGAIMMGGAANLNNPHSPQVVPGTTNTFIPDPNPALVPPVQSVTAASAMTINNVNINIGAPQYGAAGPSQADITKSWEGLRLDLKTTGGNMAIKGGDFRVANIAFPIKQEKNSALRFDSAGTLTVDGGKFTAQGQPVPNPARNNYDGPSLISLKAKDNLVVNKGHFDIQSARVHLSSTNGKVVINGGTFDVTSKSPYPGWKTFERGPNGTVIFTEAQSSQTKKDVFGSLDTSGSLVEVNGGVFNLGTSGETTANYFNLADKAAVFNGGTFNMYGGSNFGNNKAGLTINGGTYNLLEGGYFGGRNTNGPSLNITGGTFNFMGGQGVFGYSIGVITEAAYLDNDKYNKSTIDISGGDFNYHSKDATKQEISTTYAGYGINISGGNFVRQNDGMNSITAAFNVTGQTGSAAASSGDLNISGGVFRTANPINYIRENNIVISRDDNVRLYNKNDPITDAAGQYKLHTEASVKAIFATGDVAKIKEAFAPVNTPNAVPTEKQVLTALQAANTLAVANTQEAWRFTAARNMNISGGSFDLSSTNASSFTAGGVFNFANAKMLSSGGGGTVTITGTKGINITSGTIASYGGDEKGPFALQYDNRNRLDRDRWTLGKYLNFKTDGDIVIGSKGSRSGPDVYYQDGMLGFSAASANATPGNLYLYSGTLTLNGEYRSTLNGGVMNESIIDGGTLRIRTADRINRNTLDSASMWTMPVTLNSGLIDMYNAQLGGPVVMNGGTINAMGDSSVNASSASKVSLNGGTVNLGSKAYIGAIKGDSLMLSPYVTGTKDIALGDKLNVNFAVDRPAPGTTLQVGKTIGGIYASANNKGTPTGEATSIVVSDGTRFTIANPLRLYTGNYTVSNIIDAQNGQVTMTDRNMDARFYSYTLNRNQGGQSANMQLQIKDAGKIISQLGRNDNVRDNGNALASMLSVGTSAPWLALTDVVTNGSATDASEALRQIDGENTTAAAQNMATLVKDFRGKLQGHSKSNISGLSSGETVQGTNYRAWIAGMGSWSDQGTRDSVQGYDASNGGLALGFDTTFAQRYTLGLGLGYASSYLRSKDSLSKTNADTWFASLYGSMDFDPLIIDADVTYANTFSRITNNIGVANVFGENDADFGMDTWSAAVKGTYVFSFNNKATKLAPYVGIEFLSVTQHGYSESGPFAREFGSDTSTLWTIPVGVKLSHELKGETWAFTPEIGVGYARDLNEFKPAARVSVPGMNGEVTSYGSQLAPDSLRANAGFSLKYKDNLDIFAAYSLDARDKYTNHGVNVGFSYSF